MGSFGNDCIVRPTSWFFNSYTHLFLESVAPEDGVLTSACIYINTIASNGKIKVFRINGLNYDFVGESPLQLFSVGLNTITGLNISIKTGDILAAWNASRVMRTISALGNTYTHAGDVTTNTLISSWGFEGNMLFSVGAEYILPPQLLVLGMSPSRSTGASVSGGIGCGKGKKRR